MADTAAHILTEARDLIATKGWTQFEFARTADSRKLLPGHNFAAATCFCVRGAILAVTNDTDHPAQDYLLKALGVIDNGDSYGLLAQWNDADDRTGEQVIDLYDRAIALAQAES